MTNSMTALGMLELSSIGVALAVEDRMLKAADVRLLIARTICSGKYMVMIGGATTEVQASVKAGREASKEALIDELVIPNVDKRVFPAISGVVDIQDEDKDALGILEAFSVTSIVEGADAALKAADVTLFKIHIAMAIGGKGFLLLGGAVSDVEVAIEAGAREIGKRGLLVSRVVIPRPEPELFQDLI